MNILEELTAFHARFPGCLAVVFADLSTGMVLAARAREDTKHETLDRLCEAGRRCLFGRPVQAARRVFGDSGNAQVAMALHTTRSGLQCFLKAPHPATEALCLLMPAGAPLDDTLEVAAELLRRIALED